MKGLDNVSDAFHKLTLETHQLKWENDLPFSLDSNDIFFQVDALDEIEHVFIKPNLILQRALKDTNLVIGEIGFGFGLNFLSTSKPLSNSPLRMKPAAEKVDKVVFL